ncbi:MAG: 30S ribosomal protein S5 [Endomicrobia bacterium]|nr:30S ribosomal protein S5 [Endomicrobiia bacterium]
MEQKSVVENVQNEEIEQEVYSSEESYDTDVSIEEQQIEKHIVLIRRVAKVVKGGKRLSFSALVVVGNKQGRVGFSTGKAKEVPAAIEKASKRAMKNMIEVKIIDETIPHEIYGKWGATKVLLKPAKKGTGVIAGLTLRAVMDAVGIKNVVTKVIGSTNPINVVQASFEALKNLQTIEEIKLLRKQQ